MTGAPDFHEPVVGFRAWHLGDDGLLRGWTFSQHAWEAGVTTAVCTMVRAHRPPVAACSCGLYALREPSDRRLDFHGDQVIGAVAAWGELEVHATGFRAEHACVVAIAVPDRPDPDLLDRLERVAERHRVRLVPAQELSAEARRHGSPLPDLHPARAGARVVGGGGPPAVDAAAFAAAARGLVPDAHLWVETALGCVVVGLTRQLARAVGAGARVDLVAPGTRVAAGDRLGTVRTAGSDFAVWAPVGGTLLAVNPRLAEADVLHDDPEGAGWLVRVLPDAWEQDAPACSWDRGAGAAYAGALVRDAERGTDPFADVRLERLRAVPPVRSWLDVAATLEAERSRGRFPDVDAVRAGLIDPVASRLARDAELRRRLGRLDRCVAFELTDEATAGQALVLDLRPLGVTVLEASFAPQADLRLACTADVLHRWLTGTLDPAAALRCGELRSSRPAGEALRALAVLKHLRIPRRPPAPSWHR